MVELIIGKAKTGKSKYIFNEMDEACIKNNNVIFFVPSQMRMLSEEKYLLYQGKNGIININFTTISSFISDYIQKNNLHKNNDNYLSSMDKRIIINKVISDNQDIFNIFKKCKNLQGFSDSMQIYMDLFKKNEIKKEDLENIDKNDDILLYSKFSEIYSLYEKYKNSDEIKRYIDSIDEIGIFLENYNEKNIDKDYIKNTKIYIDSYNNFTKSEIRFISRLIKMGFDIKIAITSNILEYVDSVEDVLDVNKLSNILNSNENNIDMFKTYNLTLLNIIKEARVHNAQIEINPFLENPNKNIKSDILYLINNIYSLNGNAKKKLSSNVQINYSTNVFTEVTSVAKDILEKVRKNGERYKDFTIYVSDIDGYEPVIKNIFSSYKVPVHIDSKVKVTNNVIYKYIQNILLVSCGRLNYDNLFNTLKLNLLDISKDDIAYFENYCLEFNICEEYKLKKSIVKSENIEYDVERLNSIKCKTVDIFLNLKEKLKDCNLAKDIVIAIYNHLCENNVLKNFESVTNSLKNSKDLELSYIADTNLIIWDSICNALDSIVKIYGDESITVPKFLDILKRVLSDVTKKGVPPSIDEVEVLDINVSKSLEKKNIYFLGVNEGKLPLNIEEDLIFSDSDILKLSENYGITVKEDSISKNSMQNFNIYEAISNAQCFINFSYALSDVSGKTLTYSSLITNIKEILDVDIKNSDEKLSNIYTKREILEKIETMVESEEIDYNIIALYNYLLKSKDYSDILTYTRNSDTLSSDTLKLMYNKNEVNSSISRLEQFKKCPFSYFVKYNLKIDERKVYKITSLDLGSFMHGSLERFSKYLWDNNIMWHEILTDEEKYLRVLDDIIDLELEEKLSKFKENFKYNILRKKLVNAMRHAAIVIAKGFNQSHFKPYAYELEFSDKSDFKPIQIRLSDEKTMNLVGKIDRVDTAKIDDITYARIVDYKSSAKDITIEDVKEGISLQLITYISAFTQKLDNVKPAGVMYFNLSDKLTSLGEYVKDEEKIASKVTEVLRMKGIFLSDIKVLELMDKKIDTQDRLINVSMRTAKSGKLGKSLIDEEGFLDICTEIKDILKDIGSELILKGSVEIKPHKKISPCTYCKYMGICRRNNMI